MTQDELTNRLATVGDFEKVRTALENPNSQPLEYRIRAFGFCQYCKDVTEYYITFVYRYQHHCQKCNWNFCVDDESKSQSSHPYLTGDKIPGHAVERIAQLHSREQQKVFFGEKMERFIQKCKTDVRAEKLIIRRLAALRS